MKADIRKTMVLVEDTHKEMGRAIDPPTRRAVAIAVIANPFAGEYVENLEPLMEIGAELGAYLGDKAVAALGIEPSAAESYGKAAVVGERGELEHAAAILHPRLGAPLRKAVEKGAALVPSSKKRGGPGTPLDVPLGHKDAGLRPQPFRRHRGAHSRCAVRRRDPGRRRGDRQRPSAAPGRRPHRRRGRGQGRAPLGRWVR